MDNCKNSPSQHGPKISLLILGIVLSAEILGQPQSLSTHIGKKEGFSESTVYAILQDRKGFIWYGTSDGLWRYDGYEHKVFQHDPKNPNSLSHNFVTCLIEDREGNLWAGTFAGGLNKFNPATNSFYHFKHDEKDSTTLSYDYISEIAEDQEGNIWVCSKILSLLNKATNHFIHFDNKEIRQWGTTSVYASKTGTLWLGSNSDGFSQFDPKKKKFKNYRVNHSDPVVNDRVNVIRIIKEDADGNIWLGTYGGLIKFDTKTEKITHWVHDDFNVKSLAHNSIWDIALTEKGKVWIATWGGGISCLDVATGLFENETFKQGGLYQVGSLEFPSVYQEPDGTLWFGSNAKGVFRIKTISALSYLKDAEGLLRRDIRKIIKGKEYTYFISDVDGLHAYSEQKGVAFTLPPWRDKKPNGLSGNRISSISENKNGTLFIGTDFGLTIYDPATKKINYLLNDPKDSTSLSHNSILATFIDSKDRLWLGTPFGLNLLFPPANNFFYWKRPILSANTVLSIGETSEGLWVGTSTGGLNLLNTEKRFAKAFLYDEKNDSTLSGNTVDQIFTDSKSNLWIGTRPGINKYNPTSQHFERYAIPLSQVSAVSENKTGNLLVQSTEGLYELSLTKKENGDEMGSLKKVLLPQSTIPIEWSSKENRMYLFAEKEIAYLELDKYVSRESIPPIAITQFSLDPNNKHPLDSTVAILSPTHRKEITLDYDQNLFSVEFAALDFTNPAANQYAYQLEGFDEGWTYSGTRRFVTYTNLSPGDYVFRVKGTNYAGQWNEAGTSMRITILPPPWKTGWAYALYAIAFAAALWQARRIIVNRERMKAQILAEQKEKLALQDLDHLKTKFFSNITHEFRTPLTLIQGPARELYEKETNPQSRQLLTLIQNNSQRLLKLINQLLDLARLDAQEMKLNLAPVDVKRLVNVSSEQFSSFAASKNIQFDIYSGELPVGITDAEKLEAIITNLLQNAMKFTRGGGRVTISADWQNQDLVLIIEDTGRGIPQKKLANIFTRFYQVSPTDSSHSEGTGIGLALVKEYTALMKGAIEVESEEGMGTRFTVRLPVPLAENQFAQAEQEVITRTEPSATVGITPENGTAADATILLVEDNSDIRAFIRHSLGNGYRFSEAANGKEALTLAREHVPDLIISDWMMPEMDGVTLCREIKEDIRTSHIPFILLTAKAEAADKLVGLEHGANDYLVKPFNKEELTLKVRNLVQQQAAWQKQLTAKLLATRNHVEVTSAEERFVLKARNYVESNLTDGNLSVESLASAVALSREQCYRKLMALTGLSPSAFIRKIRLLRAQHLLQNKWGNVSQVAFEVGFENLSHFSKAYKEQFGHLPSET
ncbi:MAG: two-component regulator propeller domain-containing protein [Cyclobacteriaceae bacterium]|jgi:signal transduction histidine kinase/ligand-binding sensor domain-containing protein/DNA-binding response OmpR family regulator